MAYFITTSCPCLYRPLIGFGKAKLVSGENAEAKQGFLLPPENIPIVGKMNTVHCKLRAGDKTI